MEIATREVNGTLFLDVPIEELKVKPTKETGLASGYSRMRGSPTDYVVRLQGHKRWMRVYYLTFSNVLSFFLRKRREVKIIVPDSVLGAAIEESNKRKETCSTQQKV